MRSVTRILFSLQVGSGISSAAKCTVKDRLRGRVRVRLEDDITSCELHRLNGSTENGSTTLQTELLMFVQPQRDSAQRALGAHEMGQAQSHAFAAWQALDSAANR